MRTLLGGMVWAWLMVVGFVVVGGSATAASAQVVGRIESIGLDGLYRPGCWTPMFVKLQTQGSPTGLYELRVWQYDLDGDRPYYSTRVTLTAGRGEQGFWTYFIPEAIRGGLTGAMSTVPELQQRLRVTVHDANGRELTQVPVGNSVPQSVDPNFSSFERGRGRRLVVFVAGGTGSAAPPIGHYDTTPLGNNQPSIVGLQEDVTWVRLRPDQLPESPLGLDGVDAIVWLEGDPEQLDAGGSRRLDAIRRYVERGGHLAISTPASWQQLLGFGELLPVDLIDTESNALQSPARDIANTMTLAQPVPTREVPSPPRRLNPWDRFKDPFTIAIGKPRPGAVVDRYADRVASPKTPADQTPWLVRRPLGYGCVTWVAQDLGSRDLGARANWGWPRVWELVLGSGSQPLVFPGANDVDRYRAETYRDLGNTVLEAMNLSGRAATLVGVTVLFFIAYWAIAGPGTYFFLRYRGKATASWFVFGAVALGATAVTLGVVRVVLRGAAEVKHISLVRVQGGGGAPASGGAMPAMAISRMGVYVPRDGRQAIELQQADPTFASTISPYPIHPMLHQRRDGDRFLFPSPIEYGVRVPTGEENAPPHVDVPFRSTMKRLRVEWFGASDARIDGRAALRPSSAGVTSYIGGLLQNRTGSDLRNVYVAFRHQMPGGLPTLWMMHVPTWKVNEPLDLGKAFNPPEGKTVAQMQLGFEGVQPNALTPVRGQFANWGAYLAARLRKGGMNEPVLQNDLGEGMPASVPMLSFFSQFPPGANESRDGQYDSTRADLYRSGLRDWDVGPALIAGQLVIVAQADNTPVPVPMTIAEEPVTGNGTAIYQFVLPLDPIPDPPATRPTTTTTTRTTY